MCLMAIVMLLSVTTTAQCSKQFDNAANVSIHYGSAETIGGGITIIRENVMYGLGYATYFGGVNETKELPSQAYYGTLGYQLNKFSLSILGGGKDSNKPKTTSPLNTETYNTKIVPFYGGFVGYRVAPSLKLNLGYDTFNEVLLGFSVRI